MCNTFGEFVKEKRTSMEMSIHIFAKLLKISCSYESSIENGRRPAPSEAVLKKMAIVLRLNDTERARLFDLAGKTKGAFPNDLAQYINENQEIIDIIRISKENNVPDKEWKKFKNQIIKKYYV